MIKTSISISHERKKRLIEGARLLGITVTDLLAVLMHKSRLSCTSFRSVVGRSVRYQDSIPACSYVIMNVLLFPSCYEYGVSERLVFKISVSKIYAIMIDCYLGKIVQNGIDAPLSENDLATNCFFVEYGVDYVDVQDKELWVIKWDRRTKKRKRKKKRP